MSKPKCDFTPLGDSYHVILKTLLSNKIMTLPGYAKPYEPEVKPKWWNDYHYCEYHNNKAHKTENFIRLKHVIQDLIENGKFFVDGLVNNYDHKAFKEPLPKYDKGEASTSKKDEGAKINYTYTNNSNVINMIELMD